MAEKVDDGGPAFPGFEYVPGHGPNIPVDLPHGGKEWAVYASGMSLRDWFAGQAITALATSEANFVRTEEDIRKVVERAYRIADAMIVARSKKAG